MQTISKKISELKHPTYNPRKISDADFSQLKKSLEKFGAVDPAIVNTYKGREGIIVGGNQRIDAAKSLGWKEYPCILVKLSLKLEKELNVRLNRNTGEFDWDILKEEYDLDDLIDFGFDKEKELFDFKNEDTQIQKDVASNDISDIGAPENDNDNDVLNDDDGSIKESKSNDVSDLVYCALRNRFDIGRGICTYGCLYCFTQATPASVGMKNASFKLTTKKDINNHIHKAKESNNPLTIGVCNDPTLPIYRERLIYLLQRVSKEKVYTIIQTKNPKILLQAIDEAKVDPSLLCAKVSFSFLTDDKSEIIEPNVLNYSERMAGLNQCIDSGMDGILRFQPLIVGYYENMDKTFKDTKASRVVVEPLRVSVTGMRYFQRIEPCLDVDNYSIKNYLERVGNKTNKFYGALHWYDYDSDILHEAFLKVKELANRYKISFGICSGFFGVSHAELNDGIYCCRTKRQDERGLSHDKFSLSSMCASGRVREILLPILQEKEFCDINEYILMVNRISWANEIDGGVSQHYRKIQKPAKRESVKTKKHANN